MAISAAHYAILKLLKGRGLLPSRCRILELGEANYYGDFDPKIIFQDAGEECDPEDVFALGKLIYKAIFEPTELEAIDAGGPTARQLDLNHPVSLDAQFDVVYNHGTAEHVFNIAQVFETMHEATTAGGLMIHEGPFLGWVDHGFYCLQPTLFWDVAAVNGYRIEFFGVEHLVTRGWREFETREEILQSRRADQLPDNLMLFVVMRKQNEQPFQIPIQGVYGGTAGDVANQAWKQLR